MSAPLSNLARRRKLAYFLPLVPRHARILEIGCADGWVGRHAVAHGWRDFTGIDVVVPDRPLAHRFVHGDVNRWAEIGLPAGAFDAIIAFEVLEHGDFYAAIRALLRPGGLLLATTPVPRLDPLCRLLELVGLNQRRSSPHTHLIDLRRVPSGLVLQRREIRGGLSQWGVLRNAEEDSTSQD